MTQHTWSIDKPVGMAKIYIDELSKPPSSTNWYLLYTFLDSTPCKNPRLFNYVFDKCMWHRPQLMESRHVIRFIAWQACTCEDSLDMEFRYHRKNRNSYERREASAHLSQRESEASAHLSRRKLATGHPCSSTGDDTYLRVIGQYEYNIKQLFRFVNLNQRKIIKMLATESSNYEHSINSGKRFIEAMICLADKYNYGDYATSVRFMRVCDKIEIVMRLLPVLTLKDKQFRVARQIQQTDLDIITNNIAKYPYEPIPKDYAHEELFLLVTKNYDRLAQEIERSPLYSHRSFCVYLDLLVTHKYIQTYDTYCFRDLLCFVDTNAESLQQICEYCIANKIRMIDYLQQRNQDHPKVLKVLRDVQFETVISRILQDLPTILAAGDTTLLCELLSQTPLRSQPMIAQMIVCELDISYFVKERDLFWTWLDSPFMRTVTHPDFWRKQKYNNDFLEMIFEHLCRQADSVIRSSCCNKFEGNGLYSQILELFRPDVAMKMIDSWNSYFGLISYIESQDLYENKIDYGRMRLIGETSSCSDTFCSNWPQSERCYEIVKSVVCITDKILTKLCKNRPVTMIRKGHRSELKKSFNLFNRLMNRELADCLVAHDILDKITCVYDVPDPKLSVSETDRKPVRRTEECLQIKKAVASLCAKVMFYKTK